MLQRSTKVNFLFLLDKRLTINKTNNEEEWLRDDNRTRPNFTVFLM